jgi:hypothetical protein
MKLSQLIRQMSRMTKYKFYNLYKQTRKKKTKKEMQNENEREKVKRICDALVQLTAM